MVFYDYDLPGAALTQQRTIENQTGSRRRNSERASTGRPLPRYLDLSFYAGQSGVPFTFSSNLLHALQAAIKRAQWDKRFAELQELSSWVRPRLRELGFKLIGEGDVTSPAVVTIALPGELNSVRIGNLIQESGYLLSYNSEYLQHRNWLQMCFMSECGREKVVSLLSALNRICFPGHADRILAGKQTPYDGRPL
jgi:aspartate aminotransferase-like enzyme